MSRLPSEPSSLSFPTEPASETSPPSDTKSSPPAYASTTAASDAVPDAITLEKTCVVPWRDGFRVGHGVDGLTGADRAMAVVEFTPEPFPQLATGSTPPVDTASTPSSPSTPSVPGPSSTVTQYIHLCSTTKSVRETYSSIASAEGALNFEPLDLRANLRTSALHHVRSSSTTFSLVAQWRSVYEVEALHNGQHMLEQTAESELRSSPLKFREKYGDYFVAGYRRGSQFDAVLTFECRDAAQREAAISSLQGSVGLKAEHVAGKAELKRDLSRLSGAFKASLKVSLHISMRGVSSALRRVIGHDDVKDGRIILDTLADFIAHLAPERVSAELRLYSLASNAPAGQVLTKLPASIGVFSDLDKIRTHLFTCTAASASLRPVYSDADLERRLNDVLSECRLRQTSLPTDEPNRRSLLRDVSALSKDYDYLSDALEFWNEMRRAKGSNRPPHWTLGMQKAHILKPVRLSLGTSTAPFIVEHTTSPFVRTTRIVTTRDFQRSSTGTRPNKSPASVLRTIPAEADAPEERIVGWSVVSQHSRHEMRVLRENGGLLSPWTEVEGPVFSISSGLFYNGEWEITVYVLANKYLDKFDSHPPATSEQD